ncbi:Transketolase 1 [Rickettsiales bacterium Ac37b]|nr:Transketolase 1 [Rickettsiales bacterium Ac37b]
MNKLNQINDAMYNKMANSIRMLTVDAVERANSGHPGMPMGMADVATVLVAEFLKFDPLHPKWHDRDRLVVSAGHGSMLLYALYYLLGYQDINIEDIKNFRQLHAKTAGHPEYGHFAAIETTTGPLGQGLANAVGMAIAERILAARFGNIIDHHIYVIAGDGCLMEGISYEATALAGHLELSKLIVLFDDNNISIDGPVSLATSENQLARFEAAGWHVQSIDGHNIVQIRGAIKEAKNSTKPSLIACKTIIGYGAPTKAATASVHGSPLGSNEAEGVRKNLNWTYPPFMVPEEILSAWHKIAEKGKDAYEAWHTNFESPSQKEKFEKFIQQEALNAVDQIIDDLKKKVLPTDSEEATRKSSGKVLSLLTSCIPQLIGGSADLTGSNDTKTKTMQIINKDNFLGNYIHYGIREHAMAAIMNGIALYKCFIPYGGTFLVFADYCRPAIRLSALMQQQVIYVMTHDSIGLGEDGPTHQPIEHLASLRAIPGLAVYRPADIVEVAECWQLILKNKTAPAVIVLTRQNVPVVRREYNKENLSALGGYILSEYQGSFQVTIFATGSEVAIALDAQKKLHSYNIGSRVVSIPCFELFTNQPAEYIDNILNNDSLKIAIEAASKYGWSDYIGKDGVFIGMKGFGASGKAEDLYKYFGITANNIVSNVLEKLDKM